MGGSSTKQDASTKITTTTNVGDIGFTGQQAVDVINSTGLIASSLAKTYADTLNQTELNLRDVQIAGLQAATLPLLKTVEAQIKQNETFKNITGFIQPAVSPSTATTQPLKNDTSIYMIAAIAGTIAIIYSLHK